MSKLITKKQISDIIIKKAKSLPDNKRKTIPACLMEIPDQTLKKLISNEFTKNLDKWMKELLSGKHKQHYRTYANKRATKVCSLGVLISTNKTISEKLKTDELESIRSNIYWDVYGKKNTKFEKFIFRSNIDDIFEELNDTLKLTFVEIEAFVRTLLIPCIKKGKYQDILKLFNVL